jgi:hypothetical protein
LGATVEGRGYRYFSIPESAFCSFWLVLFDEDRADY